MRTFSRVFNGNFFAHGINLNIKDTTQSSLIRLPYSSCLQQIPIIVLANREEKSLHHVATVAKFLDDNKSKHHLKSGFALFQLHRSYLISLNLSNVGKIFWVESERTVSKFSVMLTYSIKQAREIREFHVKVEQQWLWNVPKSVMHRRSCWLLPI